MWYMYWYVENSLLHLNTTPMKNNFEINVAWVEMVALSETEMPYTEKKPTRLP